MRKRQLVFATVFTVCVIQVRVNLVSEKRVQNSIQYSLRCQLSLRLVNDQLS